MFATSPFRNWPLTLLSRNGLCLACLCLFSYLVSQMACTSTYAEERIATQTTSRIEDSATRLEDMHVSQEHDLAFRAPANWVVAESEDLMIYLAPSAEELPWGFEYFSSPPPPLYYVSSRSAYLNREDRLTNRKRSAAEIAQTIADTFTVADPPEDVHIEPIKSVDLSGREGASLLIDLGDRIIYVNVLSITPDAFAVISAHGPTKDRSEMRSIVDRVTSTVQPLDN